MIEMISELWFDSGDINAMQKINDIYNKLKEWKKKRIRESAKSYKEALAVDFDK